MDIFGGIDSQIIYRGPFLFLLLEDTDYHFVNELNIIFKRFKSQASITSSAFDKTFIEYGNSSIQYKGEKDKYNLNINLRYEWLIDPDSRTAPRFQLNIEVNSVIRFTKAHGVYDRLKQTNILDENFIIDLYKNDIIRISLVQDDNDDINIKANSFYKISLI